jgi:outer membrane lipoprotein-sorting protein
MRKFLRGIVPAVFAIACFGFVGTLSAEAQILREILGRMDSHHKALRSLQSDVSRRQLNVQLNETDVYQGKIVLIPGKGRNFSMRLDWSKPREEILSVVNGQYVLYVPSIARVYLGSADSKKVSQGGGSVLSTMSMSEADLRANYEVKYNGQVTLEGVEVWHLRLDPKTRQSYKFAELWVDGNGMPIQGKITAHNNDTDTFLLTRLRKNETINGSIFRVNPPKSAERIKQ